MRTFTIAARELRALFLSPLAWIVAAVLTAINALMFLFGLDAFLIDQGQMGVVPGALGATARIAAPSLATAGFILMWITPILTMRCFAEERTRGTLTLLLASPAGLGEIVIGKWLAVFAMLAAFIASWVAMQATLAFGTTMDWGHLAAVAVGLLLQVGAFAAIGTWASSLTRESVIAAVVGIGLMLLLYLIDIASRSGGQFSEVIRWISLSSHMNSFTAGRFSSTDVAYFLIVICAFLTLTVRRLDAERLPS